MTLEFSEQEQSRMRRGRRRIWIATGWYLALIYMTQWLLWFLKGGNPTLLALNGLMPMAWRRPPWVRRLSPPFGPCL